MAHFVAKSGPFGRFGVVRRTTAPPWLRAWVNVIGQKLWVAQVKSVDFM